MIKQLFRKAREIQVAVTPRKPDSVIIEEIHNEFDSATDRLYNEAKSILSQEVDTEKGGKLAKLGFGQCKEAIASKTIESLRNSKKALAESIEYFRFHYPNYKFITGEEVEKICKKYHLVFGDCRYYIGEVPSKNVEEMDKFKLRQEDMEKHTCGWVRYDPSRYGFEYCAEEGNGIFWGYTSRIGATRVDPEQKEVYTKESFQICAPAKDFNTKQMRIEDGYKLTFDDPIVLQPVKDGFLIVTKWGLEASDESLLNPIHN